MRPIGIAIAVLLLAACSAIDASPSPHALHTVAFNGLCRGIGSGDDAALRGDAADPWLAWQVTPDGERVNVWWPDGYQARFEPRLAIVNPAGQVVLREGDTMPIGYCVVGEDADGTQRLLVVPPGFVPSPTT